jgi:hypothetical protein
MPKTADTYQTSMATVPNATQDILSLLVHVPFVPLLAASQPTLRYSIMSAPALSAIPATILLESPAQPVQLLIALLVLAILVVPVRLTST